MPCSNFTFQYIPIHFITILASLENSSTRQGPHVEIARSIRRLDHKGATVSFLITFKTYHKTIPAIDQTFKTQDRTLQLLLQIFHFLDFVQSFDDTKHWTRCFFEFCCVIQDFFLPKHVVVHVFAKQVLISRTVKNVLISVSKATNVTFCAWPSTWIIAPNTIKQMPRGPINRKEKTKKRKGLELWRKAMGSLNFNCIQLLLLQTSLYNVQFVNTTQLIERLCRNTECSVMDVS